MTIDPLTGLYDRRALERAIDGEVKRAARRRGSVALLTLDIDGFRELNDTLGHLIGGRLLAEAARLLLRLVRDVDVVARTGPDDFGVLLAASDEKVASRAASRLLEAFGQHTFLAREGLDLHLSVKTGQAVFPDNGDRSHDLLEAARADRERRRS